MRIPYGYKVAVVTPQGTIADMVEIEDYDLTAPLAAAELALEVDRIVAREEGSK